MAREVQLLSPGPASGLRKLSCSQTILEPGESSESHTYPTHEAVYYVVDGRGVFTRVVEDAKWAYIVQPDSIIWLPPGLPHNFRNTGDSPLRYIGFLAPVEDAMPRYSLRYKIVDPRRVNPEPEMGRVMAMALCKSDVNSAVINSVETVGVYPGGYSPWHVSAYTEEVFYFLSGCGTLAMGEKKIAVRAGSVIAVPPSIWHNLTNTSGDFLTHVTCNVAL